MIMKYQGMSPKMHGMRRPRKETEEKRLQLRHGSKAGPAFNAPRSGHEDMHLFLEGPLLMLKSVFEAQIEWRICGFLVLKPHFFGKQMARKCWLKNSRPWKI